MASSRLAYLLLLLLLERSAAQSVSTLQPGAHALPATTPGNLFVVTRVSSDAARQPAARSYDGHDWESAVPLLLTVTCESGDCAVQIPSHSDGGYYELERFSADGAPSAEETAARLLMQAAFGPDRTSVASLAADLSTDAAAAVEGWVHAQMALPATLLRSYFRSKANPRLHSPLATGGVRRACDASSRWHRYAFSKEDVGKALSVSEENGVYSWRVNSEIRVELDSPSLAAGEYTLCAVNESVDGMLLVGAPNDACTDLTSLTNPTIVFRSQAAIDALFLLPASSATLTPIAGVADAAVLDALVGEPTLPPCTESILRTEGSEFWRFDGRLHLEQNTLDSPAAGAESELTYKSGCPNVAKTFLTRGKCKLQETCAPLVFGSQLLQLDAATLRAFYTLSSKYVYVVEGLRLEVPYDESPCSAATTRWEFADGPCDADSPLDPATRDTIVDAIAGSSDTTNPYVRDVTIDSSRVCLPEDTVGASLTVDNDCWTHVHPDHLDVRDFSYWARGTCASLLHPVCR